MAINSKLGQKRQAVNAQLDSTFDVQIMDKLDSKLGGAHKVCSDLIPETVHCCLLKQM